MKKRKLLAFTFLLLFCFSVSNPISTYALTEAEVKEKISNRGDTGKEELSGYFILWFFVAIGFLKVSQKMDSYLSGLGLNVGHTGGSMLGETMAVIKSLQYASGGFGSKDMSGGGSGGLSGSSDSKLLQGGLAGAIGRNMFQSAKGFVTGEKQGGISSSSFDKSLNGGTMLEQAQGKEGDFANKVIGSVAHGDMNKDGSISGIAATKAFGSYFGLNKDSNSTSANTDGMMDSMMDGVNIPQSVDGNYSIPHTESDSSIEDNTGLYNNHLDDFMSDGDVSTQTFDPISYDDSIKPVSDSQGSQDSPGTSMSELDTGAMQSSLDANTNSYSIPYSPDALGEVADISNTGIVANKLGDEGEVHYVNPSHGDSNSSYSIPNEPGGSSTNNGESAEQGSSPISMPVGMYVPPSPAQSTSDSSSINIDGRSSNHANISVSENVDAKAFNKNESFNQGDHYPGGGFSDSISSMNDAISTDSITIPQAQQTTQSIPEYSNMEIGGGRITGTETSTEYPEGIKFAMYSTGKYSEPNGDYSIMNAVDNSKWYKQYATDAVQKTPYQAGEKIAYKEEFIKKLPNPPQRKDRQ